MSDNQVLESIQDKYDSLLPYLNEKTRRIWAAIEARSLGLQKVIPPWAGLVRIVGLLHPIVDWYKPLGILPEK